MVPSKTCPRCETHKPAAEFNKNKRSKSGLQTYCRECQRERDREHYANNPERRRQITKGRKRNNKRYRRAAEQLVVEHLRSHPCVDCGETDIVVLQFDHVRGKKDVPISVMVTRGYSTQRIQKEIEKCEVRCGNCHQIRTAHEQNYLTVKILEELLND